MLCFSFILLTHEGSHREVYQKFQPSYDIFHSADGAKGCSDHRFRVVGKIGPHGPLPLAQSAVRPLDITARATSYIHTYRFRAPPAYTAKLLTLHQYRANNQYRAANQI